jgi:uncharacterized protein YggU (UPF0235/DUF167 family)
VIAETFGVPRGSVTLIRGPASRRKLIDIHVGPADEEMLTERLRRLLVDQI